MTRIGRKKKKKRSRPKLPALRILRNRLDKVFSKFIRKRDSDQDGNAKCVTCPRVLPWVEMQCGHWIKRQHAGTRWHELNCAAQCAVCNLYNSGRQDVFAGVLLEKYGADVVQELLRLKVEGKKHSRAELMNLIEDYSGDHQ